MKYSIIMPYYRRMEQLSMTFKSFDHHYRGRDDFEIVIVEDYKNSQIDHERLREFITYYRDIFNVVHVESPRMENYNPAPLYNIGAVRAQGKIHILTSPEIFHHADVLGGLDKEFEGGESKYVVCSCKNVSDVVIREDFEVEYYAFIKWYQHSRYKNKQFHFCTAITEIDYMKLGGFDNLYTDGIGYDDDDFIRKVRESPMEIVNRDDLVTLHQHHPKESVKVEGYMEKLKLNKDRYDKKWELKEIVCS